jgi:hypothetical protein
MSNSIGLIARWRTDDSLFISLNSVAFLIRARPYSSSMITVLICVCFKASNESCIACFRRALCFMFAKWPFPKSNWQLCQLFVFINRGLVLLAVQLVKCQMRRLSLHTQNSRWIRQARVLYNHTRRRPINRYWFVICLLKVSKLNCVAFVTDALMLSTVDVPQIYSIFRL